LSECWLNLNFADLGRHSCLTFVTGQAGLGVLCPASLAGHKKKFTWLKRNSLLAEVWNRAGYCEKGVMHCVIALTSHQKLHVLSPIANLRFS